MKKVKNGNRRTSLFIVFIIAAVLLNCFFPITQDVSAATVKLNKKSATLWVGDTLQLKLQNTKESVKWKSNRSSVASVSAKGKVKAKKSGKAVITATVKSKKYKCTITVRQTSISAENLTLVYGTSEPLTLKYPKGVVAWTSSDRRIAEVEGERLYAKSVGEAIIIAKCNRKYYTCNVKVVSGETEELREDGIYTSKDKVASYLHTYGKLPKNFITKEQAKALCSDGGPLLFYAPDKCIGGDIFRNYEKTLPTKEDRVYYECDINTLGALERGVERLVYSNDGLIYYTADHYTTFEAIYGE